MGVSAQKSSLQAKRSFAAHNHASSHQNLGPNGSFVGTGQTLLCGYLLKRGGGRSTLGNKGWKQRWCVLADGQLGYYESQEAWKKAPEKTLKPPYQLVDCDVLPGENEKDFKSDGSRVKVKGGKVYENTYAFRIQPRTKAARPMILRCTDREQRSMWMEQFSVAVQYTDVPVSGGASGSAAAGGGAAAGGAASSLTRRASSSYGLRLSGDGDNNHCLLYTSPSPRDRG